MDTTYTDIHDTPCSPLDITIPGLSVEEETYIRDQLKLLPALSPAMLVRYERVVGVWKLFGRSKDYSNTYNH